MRTFTDAKGRAWQLDVTLQTLLDIRDELGLNMLDPPRDFPDTLEKIGGVLWVCCRPQERGISRRDFVSLLSGDCLHAGLSAYVEEVASFFDRLDPPYAVELRTIWVQAEKVAQQAKELAEIAFSSVCSDSAGLPASIHAA